MKEQQKVTLTILFKDGTEKEIVTDADFQVWPAAIKVGYDNGVQVGGMLGSYPVWDGQSHNNLYARVMTLLEATVENPERLKAIKTLFQKELGDFTDQMNRKWNYYEKVEGREQAVPYDENRL